MPASRSATTIGIILLLWGIMGVVAFLMQYSTDLAELARTDPVGARIFAEMPGWVWAAYGLAVLTSVLGSIALLLRRSAASLLYLVSLICVLVQFGYSFLATDLIEQKGVAVAAGFPLVIVAVAIFQLLYARNLVARRILR